MGFYVFYLKLYPAFRCNSSLRGSASLHSGIFSTIRARVEAGSINDRRKKLLSKEQKSEQQKNNPQKQKVPEKTLHFYNSSNFSPQSQSQSQSQPQS